MEQSQFSYYDNPLPFVTQFENIFYRLLAGEKLGIHENRVSFLFNIIATHLMAEIPAREYHWYDDVVSLEARIRKTRQIEFTGEMWVMSQDKGKDSGKEDFRATVTNKRITKQGIWIVLQIGEDRAEGNLSDAFGQE